MGNSTTQTQQQSATPYTPSWLTGYYSGGANQAQGAQAALPNLTALYNQFPTLGTAPLTGAQNSLINQFNSNIGPNGQFNAGTAGLASLAGQTPSSVSAGTNALSSFLGTPGTPSAATKAEIKEFNDLQAPEILQQASLMGQGNSGAAQQALAQAQEAALVPFLQQDQANSLNAAENIGQLGLANQAQRESAYGNLANLGLSQEAQTQSQLQNALTANSLPQQLQQKQLQNLFNTATNRLGYAQGIQTGPLQNFASLIGQLQNASGSTSNPKF